jgi:SAM-dependent methyltransferase
MWGNDYGYRSGVNETMRRELTEIAQSAEAMVHLTHDDIVVDIGCNDGTLLQAYGDIPITVGYDPSINVAKYALEHFLTLKPDRYSLFVDYFKKEPYIRRYLEHSAKVITAISMFYDLDDPNTFLQDVGRCLDRDGVFVIQQNYLVGMLDQLAFDNICHEHVEYYSLTSLEPLLLNNGLEVFDVVQNDINGGSFRTYIRHCGSTVGTGDIEPSDAVKQMRADESARGLDSREIYDRFAERVTSNGKQLKRYVDSAIEEGLAVYAYGASTRGGTLLQFSGLDQGQVVGAADRNPDKWGKVMKSTGIPIVSEEEARTKADVFVVLPWFFAEEFKQRERKFVNKGGVMVFPLPKFEVYDGYK